MGGACSVYGGEERHIQVFFGETGRKRPLGKPRRRWEYTIKLYLEEFENPGVDGSILLSCTLKNLDVEAN
jgi:hypothetical protein